MKYFFHVKDGLTVTLDNEGQELAGLDAVKNETAGVAADLLKGPLGKSSCQLAHGGFGSPMSRGAPGKPLSR